MLRLTKKKFIGATIINTKTGEINSLAPKASAIFRISTDKMKFKACELMKEITSFNLRADLNTYREFRKKLITNPTK